MRLHGRMRLCVGIGLILGFVTLAAAQPIRAAAKSGRDLVVLDHERWLDTLKVTIKNYSKRPARDVTLVVKLFDKKRKALGTQRINVGDLRSGDQGSWSLAISDKHRAAEHYAFETHALWE